jgi:hypothetical protein
MRSLDFLSQNLKSATQNARNVVMVPPKEFGFNPQTALDNEFQHSSSLSAEQVREKAMDEFSKMVSSLRQHGVNVMPLDYTLSSMATPDAVFPNNWFCSLPNGELHLFPMACENRREEVRTQQLQQLLTKHRFKLQSTHDQWLAAAADQTFLESTGVMIFDHLNKELYAGLSQRCDRDLLERFAEQVGYKTITFQTQTDSGTPVYHTNVMMALGERFAVICDEVIPEFERRYVIKQLAKTKQVISITADQMAHFCGNILQLENHQGDKVIAMSQSAFDHFTDAQKAQLATHGQLLPFDVSTIESIGGGSVRCMLAEVFAPQQ